MARKKAIYRLVRASKQEIDNYLHKDVFSDKNFNDHLQKTSDELDIDPGTVRDAVESYIRNVSYLINAPSYYLKRIPIRGWLTLIVKNGHFRKFQNEEYESTNE